MNRTNTIDVKITLMSGVLTGILMLSSCGPVNRFTRVKKIPREYSLNYCGGEGIKAPKTEINKSPWVVYSDREKNASYNNPGGKVKAKEADFLDPFLVIGTKGDYLKLIKYTPDILKNGKLDYKKAEYYGWMQKSKLLLNHQSVTDIAGGRKDKMMVIFTDTVPVNHAEMYFGSDSVKVYKDLKMESPSGNVAPYSIVYRMKQSEKEDKSLISKKTILKPEEVKQDVPGWIDNSLIKDIGQVLHVNMSTLPSSCKVGLKQEGRNCIFLSEDIQAVSMFLSEQYRTTQYTPVTSYSIKDTLVAFRAHLPMPVFDTGNNYIININGGHISLERFKKIADGLKHINIFFVLEGKEYTVARFPQIVNAIQNLQQLFEQTSDSYAYRFGCVMTIDDSGKRLSRPVVMPLTSDFSGLVNFLTEKVDNKDRLNPIKPTRAWSGIYEAADLSGKYKDESNLIVVIGETGYADEMTDSALISKFADNNCRLIGFQVYAVDDNASNNFVLDMETIIDSYAETMKKTKGDILVSPAQIKQSGSYIETGETKNGYRLDFPDNSITQGAIFFPPKGEYLSLDVLTNNVDTIVRQMKEDNASVIRYMSRAFNTVGNNRTRFDKYFAGYFGLDTLRIPSKNLISGFKDEIPAWSMATGPIILTDSLNRNVDYRLMVSESEMEELKDFVAALSKKEVEYIYQAEAPKQKDKPCNCDEDLFEVIKSDSKREQVDNKNDTMSDTDLNTISAGEYDCTYRVRKYLKNLYMNTIKYCKRCKQKGKILKSMSLAEAQRQITGSPSAAPALNKIKIKDLMNEKIVTDKMLEDLILYFKSRKDDLNKAEKFESNGQTYYWVDRKLLP
ncbi:MAG: hypothetical protein FWF54_01505 [Candidatus Azobacteroides sp.]|nr:hypothetical protein [Candidatus Azobacteroides sp.]